jgi:peptidoglycan/xylan/chitin deacetylase (PgdA/CDA1 family)
MKEISLKDKFWKRIDDLFLSKNVQIIMYHGFTDQEDPIEQDNVFGKYLFVKNFKDQIEFLKENYNIISLEHFVQCCKRKTSLPKNAVILTFDDGYKSNYTLAYPILKEYNVPATIFIATNFVEYKEPLRPDRIQYAILHSDQKIIELDIDGYKFYLDLSHFESKQKQIEIIDDKLKSISEDQIDRLILKLEEVCGKKLNDTVSIPRILQPLDWNEISEMLKSGLVSIGSHTCAHVIMTQCDQKKMTSEVSLSRKLIEQRTGKKCALFCYPNGTVDDFNQLTKQALIDAGYDCAVTTVKGINTKNSDLFTLNRIGTQNGQSLENYKNGLLQSYQHCRKFRNRVFFRLSRIKRALLPK